MYYGEYWETTEKILSEIERQAPRVRNIYDIIAGKTKPITAVATEAAAQAVGAGSKWLPWIVGALVFVLFKKRRRS